MRATDAVFRVSRAYHGWLIVGVLFLSSALIIGSSIYAFGLFIEPLRGSFGWQRTAITASLSFMAVNSLTTPFIGRLMDRHGARPVMVASLTVFGVSFLLRPLMTDLWHWYLLSLLQFVCFSGASGLPAARLIAIWFQKSRGRTMGLTMMGNNFGGLSMPLVAGFVLASASWQSAFSVIGAISLVLAVLALLVVHERPEHIRRSTDALRNPTGRRRRGSEVALTGLTVREALRTRSFYATSLSIMLASFTYNAVLPQVGDHLANEGMSASVVPFAISLLAAFGMVGKLAFGYIADRYSARSAMMVSLGGQILFVLLMTRYPSPPLVWISVPLFGLFMGGYGSLISLFVQENFGLRYFGSISGLIGVASVVSFAAGPILAGASFDVTGGYGPAFIVVTSFFAVGMAALTQAHPPQVGAGHLRLDEHL